MAGGAPRNLGFHRGVKYLDVREVVRSRLDRINAVYRGKAEEVAEVLLRAEREILTGTRHGRVYRVPYRRNTFYTASASGEAPAERTGMLRWSWTKIVTVSRSINGRIVLTPSITTEIPYAGYLEHGTSRMASRPFERKIVNRAKPEIDRIMRS